MSDENNNGPKPGDTMIAVKQHEDTVMVAVGTVEKVEPIEKGAAASVGWTRKYDDNYSRIFGSKGIEVGEA